MIYCETCPKKRDDCTPISNIATEDEKDFICMGKNDGTTRKLDQDIFRVCFVNDETDSMYDYDVYDIKSIVAILSCGLLYEELEK